MTMYGDSVFAPIDPDHHLERIAGGNETEVYLTDDRQYVVKLKHDLGGDVDAALASAQAMRAAAEQFRTCLGPDCSIPSYFVVARDQQGHVQVLVVQPFIEQAQPLYTVAYHTLDAEERAQIAAQLRAIIQRALEFYRSTGNMPDLYGRSSAGHEDRRLATSLWRLPQRLWSFVIERSVLHSHNLLLTHAPRTQVVLVDYDLVRRSFLYRWVYFNVRRVLFWRDRWIIWRMEHAPR